MSVLKTLGIPTVSGPWRQIKVIAATAVHDLLAHPLIFLTGSSEWAWRVHDAVGEVATTGIAGKLLRVAGPGPAVRAAHDVLTAAGWEAPYMHLHNDGRGCGGYCPPAEVAVREGYVRTDDLVKGDVIAFNGAWLTVETVNKQHRGLEIVFTDGQRTPSTDSYQFRLKEGAGR